MARFRVAIAATAILLPVALSVTAGSAAPSRALGHHPDRWVMGYYPMYQRSLMPVSQIEWKDLTHLVVGAVLPRADGTLDKRFDVDATRGPKLASALAAAATSHGVIPLLMVGGAGAHDGFAAAAKHHRARLVTNLLATMTAEGFAGLDLDWEPVEPHDEAAVRGLVDALRARAPNAVLTMPVGWVTRTFPTVSSLYGHLAAKLDRINVMTYGMAGGWDGWKTWHSSALSGAGPSTPSDVALNVNAYEKAGVPAAKLGVGVGFYGTCWAGGVTRPRQRIGSSFIAADDNTMSFTAIMTTYYTAAAHHYDAAANAPYLSYPSGKGPQHCTFISYEDQRSVAAKGSYAEQRGLGSEIIWSINEGHNRGAAVGTTDPLLAAVHRSFH